MTLEKPEYKLGIRYGILLGATVVSIAIIRYRTGMIFNEDQRLSYLYWVIFFVANLVAVNSIKDANNQNLLGRAIKMGALIGFTSSFIYLLYLIVLNYLIVPELPAKLLEISKQLMMAQNTELTPDQLEDLEFREFISNPIVRGMIYKLVSIICGITYSVVGVGIIKLRNKKGVYPKQVN